MIVTCTPNPSFDRTVSIDVLRRGEVHRSTGTTTEAGGKGINVSRALAQAQRASVAVFPAAASDAEQFASLLDGLTSLVQLAPVTIDGAVRSNLTLTEADGNTTKVNEPGPTLSEGEQGRLVETVASVLRATDGPMWLVACGSLPPGCATDLHGRLVFEARAAGAHVAVDTSGAALSSAVAAGPDLIKPNLEELEALVARPLQSLGEVQDAAHSLCEAGVGQVLVSLGEYGALLVDAAGSMHAHAPAATVRNTVGAGDAALAGYLAGGATGTEALKRAVAWGTAAVASPSTSFCPPGPGSVKVSCKPPDRSLRLEVARAEDG